MTSDHGMVRGAMRAELQTLHATIETVANAKRSWTSRTSVRLILHDGAGNVGLGEAAPLPGFSRETAAQARDALADVAWPGEGPRTLADVRAVVETIDPQLPSARFAAESALASLATSSQHVPLWSLWVDSIPGEVGVATTLWSDDPEVFQACLAEAAAFQVSTVKLKVGRRDPDAEQAMLELVRRALPEVELRLDANRSIAADELASRLERLRSFDPAFLEEPTELEPMLAFEGAPFPFAVDESLAADPEARLEAALASDAIGAVVLKPTLLGGLDRCWTLATRARAAGRRAIVSHCLEGVIARAAAAHLALAIGEDAAGLGDHPALDPLSDGLLIDWIDLAWIEPPALPGLGLEVAW